MHITVVAADKLVLVNGEGLHLPDFAFDEGLHAIQFDGEQGHIELLAPDGGISTAPVTALEVQPYVDAWQTEKDRLEAEITPPQPPTLEQVKAAKQAEIRDAHNAFLMAHGVEYSEMERQTWDTQREEARALLADPQAAAPLVRAIATARNMDVLELAQRIENNTQAWSVLAGHATGQRLAFQDVLEACTTIEAVEAITVTFTNPE